MNELREQIFKLSMGSDEQIREIESHLKPTNLGKGEFLLKAGQICQHYYFIENGSLRLYYNKGEDDYTVWIGTAGQIFTNLESYLDESPGRITFQALENCTVYTIDKSLSDALAVRNNAYNTLLRRTVEIAFVALSKNVISFQSEEASERYARIEKEKNWLTQYPLRYISSFIGVTQSSLSRLRSRKR